MSEYSNTEPGDRDPLAAAFGNRQQAPRDVVPPGPAAHRRDDLDELAGQTVEVTYYEFTADGITRCVEHATVCVPIEGEKT